MWARCLIMILTMASVSSQSLELNKLLKASSKANVISPLLSLLLLRSLLELTISLMILCPYAIWPDEGTTLKGRPRISNPYIGHDGRMYACSGKSLVVFDRNGGHVEWIIPINYMCSLDITPVGDERGKIYLLAEDRVLKISPSNIATSGTQVEIFFGPNSTIGGSGEIIGLAISVSYSSLFVTIKNRGLFAILLRGKLLWSAGPLLYRFGYRQGCKKNTDGCFFSSAPVVDQCEGTLYISNTEGQLYSVYINSPHFRWIQDFSSFGKSMTIVAGNNGRLYVIFPEMALLIALAVSTGTVLWKNDVGPLSTHRISPIVDSNGWISIGSLDGFLYSFSSLGELKKSLDPSSADSAIQLSPVLDCSGFGVYVSQTLMEGKSTQTISNYTYVSATKPIDTLFTLLTPATGMVYWSGRYSVEVSSLIAKSDLRHFALDDRILLAFLASADIGSALPCYTARQKISWTCSQANPKTTDIYASSEGAIILLLLFQLVILVALALSVRFCCIFWGKKKLQHHGLVGFLEKRRFLRNKRKTFKRMISELKQKATDEAASNEALEQLGEIVRAKEGVERKLSTCYSLGSDRAGSQRGSILPVRNDGKSMSHSFHSARTGSFTVFDTVSDSSTSRESGSTSGEGSDDSRGSRDEEEKERTLELGSSSRMFTNTSYTEDGDRGMERRKMWLKRRTLSSTN